MNDNLKKKKKVPVIDNSRKVKKSDAKNSKALKWYAFYIKLSNDLLAKTLNELVAKSITEYIKDKSTDKILQILNKDIKDAINYTNHQIHDKCQFDKELSIHDLPNPFPIISMSKTTSTRYMLHKNHAQKDDVNNEPPKKGRPPIKRLCSRFKNSDIVPLFDYIINYVDVNIEIKNDLIMLLTCFYCALLSYNEKRTGKITCFHTIMKEHLNEMPSVRYLQKNIKWYINMKKKRSEVDKEEKSLKKYEEWEKLEDLIEYQMLDLGYTVFI